MTGEQKRNRNVLGESKGAEAESKGRGNPKVEENTKAKEE